MIVGFKEKNWFNPRTDFALWNQLCRAYNEEFSWYSDWIPQPDSPIVVFDEDGDTKLKDFIHPPNATYVFGRTAQYRLQDIVLCEYSVRIETPKQHSLFGVEAAAIMLAHKWLYQSPTT